jgi:hypothetical protein
VVTIISIWRASFGLFACLGFVLCSFVSISLPFLGVFSLWSLVGFHQTAYPLLSVCFFLLFSLHWCRVHNFWIPIMNILSHIHP